MKHNPTGSGHDLYINDNCNRGYSNPKSYYRRGTYSYGDWLTGTAGGSQWDLDSLEVFHMTPRHNSPCANVECPTSFCTPENVCQLGACAPTTRPDGTLCDGDDTTAFDACYAGTCIGARHHSNTTSYELPELHPGRAYSVQVQAYTSVGGGPLSGAVYGETMEAAPSAPPRAVRATAAAPAAAATTLAALAVSWAPPSLDAQRGVVVAYTLRIQRLRDSSGSPTTEDPVYVQLNGTTTSTVLTGLDGFAWYQVRLRARREKRNRRR